MPTQPTDVVEALDRLDELHACWSALGDLITPERDLHAVDRDNLAVLFSLLQRETDAARDRVRAVARPGEVPS
jgi:hypothetical protein